MRLLISALVTLTALATGTAAASPPTPLVTRIDNLARAQIEQDVTVPTPAGSGLLITTHRMQAGTDTGWRRTTGAAVLLVRTGTLTMTTRTGCAQKTYRPAQAVVLPAGHHQLHNDGPEPVEFVAVLLGLTSGANSPFAGPAPRNAGSTCNTAAGARPTGAEIIQDARGKLVPAGTYKNTAHDAKFTRIPVAAGTDVYVGSFTLLPGFSTGWVKHRPAIALITRGTQTNYEAHHGYCGKSGTYSAGQAYVHTSDHVHLAANESTEPLEGTWVYFNLPHGGSSAIPVIGNIIDALDFTPLPPAGCTRF